MAKIVEYRDLPLADLELGKGQVRVSHPEKGIDELADSIRLHGLLQPIVVCPGSKEGKYEILIGQRRFLAHKTLQMDTIWSAVLDEPVGEHEAKAISLTENLVREGLSRKDKIDACTWLYKRYGTIDAVVEATALPRSQVQEYVKYDRLLPELKNLVDEEGMKVSTALAAQDAAEVEGMGRTNVTKAVHLAREMQGMSQPNRRRVAEVLREDPRAGVTEVVERAKSGERLVQMTVTISATVQLGVRRVAEEEELTLAEAASALIEEALVGRDLIAL